MGFRVSPGVNIKEIDLTTVVPAVATTPGGYAGYFYWGPCKQIVTVSSEKELAGIFGKPDSSNFVDFFTPANFLQYGNNIQVVRVVGSAATNAVAGISGGGAAFDINNKAEYDAPITGISTAATNGIVYAARFPGALGNSLKVVTVAGNGIGNGATSVSSGGLSTSAQIVFGGTTLGLTAASASTAYNFARGDKFIFGDGTTVVLDSIQKTNDNATFFGVTAINGEWTGITSNTKFIFGLQSPITKTQASGNTFTVKSVYADYINNYASTTQYSAVQGGSGDAFSILVLDADGKWTGTQNALLEKFESVSRATDARNSDGSSNYWRNVLADNSRYIYGIRADLADNTGATASKSNWTAVNSIGGARLVGNGVVSTTLQGGVDSAPDTGERWNDGWSYFADPELVDVSLLPVGDADSALARMIVNNICEKRLDCIAFLSPRSSDVVGTTSYDALNNIKTYRDSTLNLNTSYAVLDSGWKHQLDTYNNVIRAVPLNGDMAGLVARTEFTNEAWFSPAGFNRGQVKNVVRLAYNPTSEAHRDELYTRQVNPVVSFVGEGVVLYGDKTMQTRPSAFDRINVRRLFIVLEKAIATASKFFLFEQNDAFTRAQFKNLVVPFLKTVQQRRGITDFKVVCDETNNTGEVIDRNEFVADIFVKPTRSINFIQLNFIATKTGVNFSEVGG